MIAFKEISDTHVIFAFCVTEVFFSYFVVHVYYNCGNEISDMFDSHRNNLTVLDAVAVQGQGARGEFTLNGLKPGAHSTILFELKPNHLAECHSELF